MAFAQAGMLASCAGATTLVMEHSVSGSRATTGKAMSEVTTKALIHDNLSGIYPL